MTRSTETEKRWQLPALSFRSLWLAIPVVALTASLGFSHHANRPVTKARRVRRAIAPGASIEAVVRDVRGHTHCRGGNTRSGVYFGGPEEGVDGWELQWSVTLDDPTYGSWSEEHSRSFPTLTEMLEAMREDPETFGWPYEITFRFESPPQEGIAVPEAHWFTVAFDEDGRVLEVGPVLYLPAYESGDAGDGTDNTASQRLYIPPNNPYGWPPTGVREER